MIPRDKIDEVVSRASIVQVVGEFVPLKKRGTNYLGNCPFHSEKTPSFSVSDERGLYYCFGCHAGGNVISFLMEREGMDFPEAVRSLAERYGIEIIEERGGPDGKDGKGIREKVLEANSAAEAFFYSELRGQSGVAARSYLKGRGIDKDVAEKYRLGFAPDSWQGLSDHLKSKGVDIEASVKAGVVSSKEGRVYDRFRGRVVFPIHDARGRCVAFGARGLENEEPKYLNSSESPVFKKSDTLYGLHHARAAIHKEGFVLVAEGYFDLIALQSAGFLNSVATMGTALTKEHLRRIATLTRSVYTIFDADEAGQKAAVRGLDTFLEEEMMARVVVLPEAKDPDDILRGDGGVEEMQRLVKAAKPLMEFFFDRLAKGFDLSTPEGKRGFYDEAVPFIKKIRNEAEMAHYVDMAASMLSMRSDKLYASLSRNPDPRTTGLSARDDKNEASEVDLAKEGGKDLTESTLLKVVLRHPSFMSERVASACALFSDPLTKVVAETVLPIIIEKGGVVPAVLIDDITDVTVRSWVAGALLADDDGFIESPEKMVADCVEKILTRGKLRETTLNQIKKLEEAGKHELAEQIRERALKGTVNS